MITTRRTVTGMASLAVGTVLLVSSCVSSSNGADTPSAAPRAPRGAGPPAPPNSEPASAGIDDGSVSWDGARTAETPRRLVLTFTGGRPGLTPGQPCWEGYRPEVSVDSRRVVVTIHRLYAARTPESPRVGCTLQGYFRTLAVELPEDLAGRDLVDGESGSPRPVFDGSTLLEIGWRPKRWRLVQERVRNPGDAERAPGWARVYCPSEQALAEGPSGVDGGGCVTVIQGPASVTDPGGAKRVIDERMVRGVEGRVVTDWRYNYAALVWTEGEQGFVVESTAIGEEVVQVARKLH